MASEEETDHPSKLRTEEGLQEEEVRPSDFPDEILKQEEESDDVGNSSTLLAPAVDVSEERPSEKSSQEEVEHDAAVLQIHLHSPQQDVEEAPALAAEDPHVSAVQEAEEAPALTVEQQPPDSAVQERLQEAEAAPALVVQKEQEDAMEVDLKEEDPIPATTTDDEQKQQQEVVVASSPPGGGGERGGGGGGEVVKQEVAHRSHVLGSLSKLDENTARQLLKDSGWNVTQSVRMNGKSQWYYRSPPPKPVLVGSLTSAVATWKRLADEEHKRKGGGDDDDLYPMVTAFLSKGGKRPAAATASAAKRRKRGRYSE